MGSTATPIVSEELSIWEQIELCENYLVCSMYEEAASSASSILDQLRQRSETVEVAVLHQMMESTATVLVQSLRQLGRTSEILDELKAVFGSAAAIPIEVLLISVCFQISESSPGVKEFLEEFLSKWSYTAEKYYISIDAKEDFTCMGRINGCTVLEPDKYLEVVEVYTMIVLAKILNDVDHAISWVEKAALPEDKKQDFIRRLHSLHSIKETNKPKAASLSSSLDKHEDLSPMGDVSERLLNSTVIKSSPKGEGHDKQPLLRLHQQVEPCIWWFRNIKLRFGNAHIVITNGKILLGCLIILAFWVRRKRSNLKSFLARQAQTMKNALVDFWQLAFSYQVNPLAAVQPVPSIAASGR